MISLMPISCHSRLKTRSVDLGNGHGLNLSGGMSVDYIDLAAIAKPAPQQPVELSALLQDVSRPSVAMISWRTFPSTGTLGQSAGNGNLWPA